MHQVAPARSRARAAHALALATVMLLQVPGARAQPADPTAVKLIPRVLQEQGEKPYDPDLALKRAATDFLTTRILGRDDRRKALIALAYSQLSQAVADFNRSRYGEAVVFLKGGLAQHHHYYASADPMLRVSHGTIAGECRKIFQESDVDFGVYTRWGGLENTPADRHDTLHTDQWLNSQNAFYEVGYELLNDQVISALEKLRAHLLTGAYQYILVPEPNTGPVSVPLDQAFNTDFVGNQHPSFLRKWGVHLRLGISWTHIIHPHRLISNSLPPPENVVPMEVEQQVDYLNGLHQTMRNQQELERLLDVRNSALPDRVVLPGPTLRLLYTHQRGKGSSSVYLTSNYSQAWPTDPTINPHHYTKFALHRLKYVVPFRYQFTQTFESADVSKILKHAQEHFDDESDEYPSYYSNVYGMGGELIDVGVDHPVAYLSHKMEGNDFTMVDTVFLDRPSGQQRTVPVRYVSLDYLLKDFIAILFDNVGLPWRKDKYQKRVQRFLCLTAPNALPIRNALVPYLQCLRGQLGSPDGLDNCRVSLALTLQQNWPQYPLWDALAAFLWETKVTPYSLLGTLKTLPPTEHDNARGFLDLLLAFYQTQ